MTQYGNSRISVTTESGAIGALNLNATEKLVIFARGDPANGTVSVNDPTRVNGPGELAETFGDGSRIADAMRDAAGNGQSFNAMYGVVPETISVTAEGVSGGSGTLGNAPIIEDKSDVSVQNTTTSSSAGVVFRYESTPDPSSLDDDEVAINPDTGEVESGDSDDYEVDYKYHDWQAAFDAATDVIQPQEAGQWAVISDSESVVSDAVTTANPLRTNQFKMVRVAGGAEPNATTDDGDPKIDVGGYSDNIDDGATYLFGPVREAGETTTALGAIGGTMASAALGESILGQSLNGVSDLAQQMSVPTQEDLEDAQVIPVSDFGSPAIEGNDSTSTAGRRQTYFTRRLADRLILAARAIARAVRGRVGNPDTASLVENRLEDEIVELVRDGLLEPNTGNETKYFVSASADDNDPNKLNVSFAFTPEGVVDTVEFTATINA